jgi:hypothetical protein
MPDRSRVEKIRKKGGILRRIRGSDSSTPQARQVGKARSDAATGSGKRGIFSLTNASLASNFSWVLAPSYPSMSLSGKGE